MIQARRTAPSPYVEHFLDCAQDASEIDAGSAMVLRLYGDDAVVHRVIESDPPPRPHYRDRQRRCLILSQIADGLIPRLPPQRRGAIALMGLLHVVHLSVQLAETISNWAIDDEVDGGDMLPFRDRPRSRNGVPFKRTMRRLRSPSFIRRHVKHCAVDSADHLRALAAVALQRVAADDPCEDLGVLADYRAQLNSRERHRLAVTRHERKAERRMVLRSWRAAVSIVGLETVGAFLRGEQIKLVGASSVLVVKKRGTLTDVGHGCMSIALADRDGTMLADLCTFVSETPTLDQLSAFALWMRCGADIEVLGTANVISCTEAGRAHALLVEKQRQSTVRLDGWLAATAPEIVERGLDFLRKPYKRQLSYQDMRARNDAYWEGVKGHYIEATLTYVCGAKNFPVLRSAGVL